MATMFLFMLTSPSYLQTVFSQSKAEDVAWIVGTGLAHLCSPVLHLCDAAQLSKAS